MSVSVFEESRGPHASTRMLFNLVKERTANQEVAQISFRFEDDGEPADVTWTFTVPKSPDLFHRLFHYARDLGDDECAVAFRGFLLRLLVQKGILEQRNRREKKNGSNEDATLSKYGLLSEQVEDIMKGKRTGQWSNEEICSIILLRKQGLPLARIARKLERTRTTVKTLLQRLGSAPFESNAVEGPQDLPPGLQESLYNSRLMAIWQGLLQSEMTPAWRDAISKKSAEEWLSSITEGIPDSVKKVLGGLQPPTFRELESLPLISTSDVGVYARLVESRFDFRIPGDRYLYIGSASSYEGGLTRRISQHLEKRHGRRVPRLQRDIKKKDLKGPGRFVTFMVMKIKNPSVEDVLDVRRTVTIAEAILTIWLGALQSPSSHLKDISPWDLQTLSYTPWCSHNPLILDVVEPQ